MIGLINYIICEINYLIFLILNVHVLLQWMPSYNIRQVQIRTQEVDGRVYLRDGHLCWVYMVGIKKIINLRVGKLLIQVGLSPPCTRRDRGRKRKRFWRSKNIKWTMFLLIYMNYKLHLELWGMHNYKKRFFMQNASFKANTFFNV